MNCNSWVAFFLTNTTIIQDNNAHTRLLYIQTD